MRGSRTDCVCVYILWSWRDLLTVFQAWNTVSLPSSFNSSNAIIIMLLLVAVDHSRLVDGILVIRDGTEQRVW